MNELTTNIAYKYYVSHFSLQIWAPQHLFKVWSSICVCVRVCRLCIYLVYCQTARRSVERTLIKKVKLNRLWDSSARTLLTFFEGGRDSLVSSSDIPKTFLETHFVNQTILLFFFSDVYYIIVMVEPSTSSGTVNHI